MSRTFTPIELHMADLQCKFSSNVITMTDSRYPNEKITLYDCNATFSKKYPNLSFLFSNSEIELKDISDKTLTLIESKLHQCIKHHDERTKSTDIDDEYLQTETWYLGNFATKGDDYTNNLRFKEYIRKLDRKEV